jgi:Holliday junction resolvase RusA-like endonuclease
MIFMTKKKDAGFLLKSLPMVLKDSESFRSGLGEAKTGSTINRQKTIEELRTSMESWMKNHRFDELRKEKIDLAIVAHLDPFRFRNQDCDNIAKIVLDALEKKDDGRGYLFEDDKQVVRLLVYKRKAVEDKVFRTNQLDISFRKHEPSKEMVLEEIHTF